MASKKPTKDSAKKSPQMSKVTSVFTPPMLRHRTHSDAKYVQESILLELRESIDSAFQKVNEKIDSVLQNQHDIMGRITTLESTQRDLENSLTFVSSTVDKLQIDQKNMDASIKQFQKEINNIESMHRDIQTSNNERLKSISEAQLKAERFSRSFNLRFGGIPEKKDENPITEIKKVLASHLKIDETVIENAHRIGQHRNGSTRHIIAKLLYRPQRMDILVKARRALDQTSFFNTEDLTPEDFKKKSLLRPVMNAAYREGKRPRFRNGELYINGVLYTEQARTVVARD